MFLEKSGEKLQQAKRSRLIFSHQIAGAKKTAILRISVSASDRCKGNHGNQIAGEAKDVLRESLMREEHHDQSSQSCVCFLLLIESLFHSFIFI